ncbi:hypothetical protein BIW11_03699 [Tropilaelaps mercedesae]|uniref:Uncharacterized protein n=1 Tax=Tropilaelaps mercedesae TaxID=418985 RepID=A0A1V9XHF5_9ACAR|nr:hypothetical protein BIW11_03699 [Tropilaelaps mercedesae]
MDDVSMMSIDGNASFDVRDPGIKAVPITSETAADSENRTETISLNSSAVTTEKNGENFAPFENAPVSSGKNAYTVDDTLTPAAPVEPKERTSMGSSNHSVTPTPETDDVRKSAQLSESHSVYKAVESLNSAPESSTSESTSGSRLNGTFDKTPNKSNPDPLSGGDGLAVVLSTSGHGTPESKLNGTFDKNKSALDVNLPECPAEDCAATCSSRKLNDTFDKSPSEPSPHNGTFDKETSSLVVGDLTRTPELELRLDQTCQTEEVLDPTLESPRGEQQQNRMCSEAKTLLATPDKGEMAGRTQSTPRLTRRRASAHGGNTAREQIKAKEDDDKEDSAKSTGQRRSSGGSFLKRRCSILELSFVSSPKRANYQLNTPKGVRDSRRSGPTLLHESIAFDFSAAVATAQKNNGVAEMGSFVFAASSGQPVASDAFDLSALEKIDTSAKTNAEKYTRVSFIAMFDPIKPNSPTHDKLEEKTLAEPSGRSTESTDFKTPLAHVGSNFNISPLVKGLPTPIFAKPKAFTAATQTVAVQTESLQEAKSVTSEPQTPEINFDEVTACVADLNRLVENQQNALNAYEKVVALLKDRIVDASSNDELDKKPDSEEVSRLKESLVAERDRNAQQDEVVRNLERSMHSTLKRMAECRESNAVLTKVVEEQLAAMSLTRANCEALEHHMNEMLANAKDEIRVLKEKAQEDERSHKKALSKFDLQLKAKESELEYSQSQLAIAKKEIDSLRKLVEQMNLQ